MLSVSRGLSPICGEVATSYLHRLRPTVDEVAHFASSGAPGSSALSRLVSVRQTCNNPSVPQLQRPSRREPDPTAMLIRQFSFCLVRLFQN
jgi:hypothetical protein